LQLWSLTEESRVRADLIEVFKMIREYYHLYLLEFLIPSLNSAPINQGTLT